MTDSKHSRINIYDSTLGRLRIQLSSPNGAEAFNTATYPPDEKALAMRVEHHFHKEIIGPPDWFRTMKWEGFIDCFLDNSRLDLDTDELNDWFLCAQKCIGSMLYDFLFDNQVAEQFGRLLAKRSNKPIRLRLHIDSKNSRLRRLPWELLYAQGRHGFLCLGEKICLARYMPSMDPAPTLSLDPLQKVGALMIEASPSSDDYPLITAKREATSLKAAISQGVGDSAFLKFKWQNRARIDQLVELGDREGETFHIVHFSGHGGVQSASQGFVVLEDEDGCADHVSSDDFALALARFTNLRLLYLNCCWGAGIASNQAYRTVGEHLAQRCNLPALVAMQRPIYDKHAKLFAREFYERIATSDIEQVMAISRALLKTQSKKDDVNAWWTPVLYLRTPDPMLFEPHKTGPDHPHMPSDCSGSPCLQPSERCIR